MSDNPTNERSIPSLESLPSSSSIPPLSSLESLPSLPSLQPSLERVEAQQEVIRQTLASVQSSLARMKVAPAALTAPNITVIQSSISEVTGQTRAVEQAVQEVMSIRSG